MTTTNITCDECQKELAGGFQLDNFGGYIRGEVGAYVERPVHFCSLACLGKWTAKAEKAAEAMKGVAESLHPHGTFTNKGVPGLAVS